MKNNESKLEVVGATIKKSETNKVYFKFNDSEPIEITNLDENENFTFTVSKSNNIEFYDYDDKNKMKIYVK